MTDAPSLDPPDGAILLCAGTDPAAAARLAETAAALLAARPAVVLAAWPSLPVLAGGADVSIDLGDGAYGELRERARRAAEATARAAAEVLEATGVGVTVHVCPEERSPWQAILDVAERAGAAVIAAGTGEGAAGRNGALGQEARALAHRTRRPLLLVAPDGGPPDDDAPAIFATDGSATAHDAIAAGTALLRPRPTATASVWQSVGATLGAARIGLPDHVAREGGERLDEAARGRAARDAGDGAELLAAAGRPAESIAIEGAPNVAAAIVAAARDRGAAVIVTGTRGRSRIAAALLGSTAEGVVRHAARPVLLVPAAADR